jgi:CBS domain-containing protein
MNQIQQRVADFIKNFPPFDLLDAETLASVASAIDVYYSEGGEVLFRKAQEPKAYFFIVRKGSVRISADEALIDLCDEGDVFGVRALIANDSYLADAIADENTILYKIPLNIFKKILQENPNVANYFTAGFASGKPLPKTPFRIAASSITPVSTNFMSGMQIVEGRREVLHCTASTSIQEAAKMMSSKGVGSIVIVDDKKHPVGIITDKDFRRHIAAGNVSIQQEVKDIMSSPVRCVAPEQTQTDYLISMLNLRVHHLCLTQDGSADSPVVGMITEHDLLLLQGTNPAVILREMDKAASLDDLDKLRKNAGALFQQHLKQNVPIHITCRLATAINDRLISRIIEIELKALGPPPCVFSWLSLGSLGREEQIVQTDQDHALIFKEGEHQDYFLELALRVSNALEKLGFPRDPADVSAENPKWCMSLDNWKKQFTRWIRTPEPQSILHCNIFFDFRVSYGDGSLAESLRSHFLAEQSNQALFTTLLAKEATETPAPLSFFRNLVVERSEAHKDQFDLKLRVLLPLVDCARVLAITEGISATQSILRYNMLSEKHPQHSDLLQSAAEAMAYALRLKAQSGFENKDNGRYIAPESLGKLDRQMLRNVFETISDLQQMLRLRFQTDVLK